MKPTLKQIADKVNLEKLALCQVKAEKQVEEVYCFIRPIAERGGYEATYRGPLCKEAIQLLKEGPDSIKVRYDGEGFANLYNLSWYSSCKEKGEAR